MRHDPEGWVPPWRPGLPQARCQSANCTPDGVPGTLVVAITLSPEGYCAACARTVDDTHTKLRLDIR